MTRVAQIGNAIPEYSTENELRIALESLGVEVVVVQENDVLAWQALPQWHRADPFDFVLWTTTHSFDVDVNLRRRVLDEIRETGTMVVGYHLDRWFGLERESQIESHPFFTHTDLLCTADGGHEQEWADLGIRHEWFPPAISARHVGLAEADRDQFPFDVVFVGSFRTYHKEWPWRTVMIQALVKRYRRRGMLGLYPMERTIRGADLSTLYATAKVVVGDSCLAGDAQSYWSDRVPETLGRGGILVHPWVWPIADHYPVNSGALWLYERENVGALFDTIDKALDMPDDVRELSRSLAVNYVGSGQTYEHRMERLLDLVGKGSNRRRLFSFGKGAVFLPREGTSDQIVVDETWRENVYRLVPEWVKGGTVVDLGANVGAVSIWAAVHGAAKVVAVEPDPANLTALHANLDENQIPFGQVVVAPWAIHGRDAGGVAGSGSCWATMEGESGGRRVLEWRGGTIRPAGAVEAVPFSVLLDPYPVVDLLKIDIEGGEWGILSEPANVALLSEKVRRMVIEFHNFGWSGVHTFGRVVESLAEVGKIEILGRPSVGGLLWWEAYR